MRAWQIRIDDHQSVTDSTRQPSRPFAELQKPSGVVTSADAGLTYDTGVCL
jgi:hypothetical protein